ncbi:hypothetical protein ACFE04_017235 [Oxalis oulophora]
MKHKYVFLALHGREVESERKRREARVTSLIIEVEDLGTSSYYSIAVEVGRRISATPSGELRVLLACRTGVDVAMMANKFPGKLKVRLLSFEIDTKCNTLAGHIGYVNNVVVSLDGSLCAIDGKDGIILSWYWFCAIRFIEDVKVDVKTEKII